MTMVAGSGGLVGDGDTNVERGTADEQLAGRLDGHTKPKVSCFRSLTLRGLVLCWASRLETVDREEKTAST